MTGVVIRKNQVGAGRLEFVAGHGAGDVSDLVVQDNVLNGHSIGIDLAAPATSRRHNVVVTGNRSNAAVGNPRAAVVRVVNYDVVDVENNRQPVQAGRNMHMVGSYNSCLVKAVGNDLGPNGAGQLVTLSATHQCGQPPSVVRTTAPAVFSARVLAIDAGGAGFPLWGVRPCFDRTHCDGYLVGGTARTAVAGTLRNVADNALAYRTMLIGNPRFSIPIRSGTYVVTLSFVEPTVLKANQRRFQVDSERQRMLLSFDVYKSTGNTNTLVKRSFSVTVGDGHLDIDFNGGSIGAIVSFIVIERA